MNDILNSIIYATRFAHQSSCFCNLYVVKVIHTLNYPGLMIRSPLWKMKIRLEGKGKNKTIRLITFELNQYTKFLLNAKNK